MDGFCPSLAGNLLSLHKPIGRSRCYKAKAAPKHQAPSYLDSLSTPIPMRCKNFQQVMEQSRRNVKKEWLPSKSQARHSAL